MSQKTLISFYQGEKKNRQRVSNLLSGRLSSNKAKKRREISDFATGTSVSEAFAPEVLEASTSAAAATSRERGETEMQDVVIESISPIIIESGGEEPQTRATKRRRTEKGREEQYSEGESNVLKNFQNF